MRRRGIIPSADSCSFHISFLTHHFICPPTPARFSCFSLCLDSVCLSTTRSHLSFLPCVLTLLQGASLVCSYTQMSATSCSLFTEHVGWNVRVCVCARTCVCASQLCTCITLCILTYRFSMWIHCTVVFIYLCLNSMAHPSIHPSINTNSRVWNPINNNLVPFIQAQSM